VVQESEKNHRTNEPPNNRTVSSVTGRELEGERMAIHLEVPRIFRRHMKSSTVELHP